MLVAKMKFKGYFNDKLLIDWVKDGFQLYISGPKLILKNKKKDLPVSLGFNKEVFEIKNDSLIVYKIDEREELEKFRKKYYQKFKISNKFLKAKELAKTNKIEDLYVLFADGEYKIPKNSNIYLEELEIMDDEGCYKINQDVIDKYNNENKTYQYLIPENPIYSQKEEILVGGDLDNYDKYDENFIDFEKEEASITNTATLNEEYEEEMPF